MVVIAEAFLQYIERIAINQSLGMNPSPAPITYKRYVDDTHCRFPDFEHANKFLDILNAQEPRIQFTVEQENDQKEMNFLDITIRKTGMEVLYSKFTEKMLSQTYKYNPILPFQIRSKTVYLKVFWHVHIRFVLRNILMKKLVSWKTFS